MATTPPITFEDETTGQVLVLGGAELPEPPLTHGGRHRKSVTRYPGDSVSVQMLGTEMHDVEIEGVLDDHWTGETGRAERTKDAMLQMWRAQNVVRFEYRGTELWGLFEARVDEELPWRYQYQITFMALWADPPEPEAVELEPLPTDAATLVTNKVDDLDGFLTSPPPQVQQTDLMVVLLLEMGSLTNKASGLLNVIEGVVDYAELGGELSGEAAGFCKGMVSGLVSMAERLKSATPASFGASGVDEYGALDWQLSAEQKVMDANQATLALLRRLLRATEPATTRTHTVRQGETLRSIARAYYGDFTQWVRIADANNLDGDDLTVGQRLAVPRD